MPLLERNKQVLELEQVLERNKQVLELELVHSKELVQVLEQKQQQVLVP